MPQIENSQFENPSANRTQFFQILHKFLHFLIKLSPYTLFYTSNLPTAGEGPSRPRRQQWAGRSPPHPPLIPDFKRVHFPFPTLARRFQTRFITRKLTDSFFVDLDDFEELLVCSSNVKEMLAQWEIALNLEEKMYRNLVRIF